MTSLLALLKQNLMTPRLITVQLPKIPPPEAPRARESKLRDMGMSHEISHSGTLITDLRF